MCRAVLAAWLGRSRRRIRWRRSGGGCGGGRAFLGLRSEQGACVRMQGVPFSFLLEGERTRRGTVRVPSTSKRQIVFAIGRLFSGGKDASAMIETE